MTTAENVAEWMFAEIWLRRKGVLEQAVAWEAIRNRFGKDFAYENEHGHKVINPSVLEAFERMTGEDVVYSFRERLWRWRKQNDKPGRKQD